MPRKYTVIDVLERAWEKIEDPERWIKKTEAARLIRSDGTTYVAYCSLGAVKSVRCDMVVRRKAMTILADAMRHRPESMPGLFMPETAIWHHNDATRTTHADIAEAFKRAIRKAKETVAMDIREIPDTETTHEPLVSPVPDKEVTPSPPEVPALPSLPAPPERVPA